jgi:Ca2+:H+ antiporter
LQKPVRDLNAAVTGALSSLMIITAVALILPTALYSTLESGSDIDTQILDFSRGTAIVLLALYLVYLYFELGSHKYLFEEQPQPDRSTTHVNGGNDHVAMEQDTQHGAEQSAQEDMNQVTELGSQQGTEQDTRQDTQQDGQQDTQQATQQVAYSSLLITFTKLLCCAVGIMLCSNFFLSSIDDTSKVTGISKTFIATILIPIASNAPECATVISSGVGKCDNDRVDFAVGVIVSSILQIALFVIPVLVMLGWVVQQPMDLNFETFQTIILFLAIVLVNHLLQNGKYTYMHGLMLIGL